MTDFICMQSDMNYVVGHKTNNGEGEQRQLAKRFCQCRLHVSGAITQE